MPQKFKNPLNEKEKEKLLKLSSIAAKNKVFSPYERKLIYYLGQYSNLFKIYLEKIPGLLLALTEWCKKKNMGETINNLKIMSERFQKVQKDLEINYEIDELSIDKLINIADTYKEQQNIKSDIKAYQYYLAAADKGSGYAQNNIGDYFLEGNCYQWNHINNKPASNYTEAIKWYEKAAKNKFPRAFTNLGICYVSGYGVKENWEKGISFFEKSFELDFNEVLRPLVQYCAYTLKKTIEDYQDETSERKRFQKYLRKAFEYYMDTKIALELYLKEKVEEEDYYKSICLELSKIYSIGAYGEADPVTIEKKAYDLLYKIGISESSEDYNFIRDHLLLSKEIFISSMITQKTPQVRRMMMKKENNVIYANFGNLKSDKKLQNSLKNSSKDYLEEEIIERGESSIQEFKNRIFFMYDKNEANTNSTKQYKKKIQCSSAIEIAKKICGFLNNHIKSKQFIRLGISDDSKPVGIDYDIDFFKSNIDSDEETKKKIKQNLLDNLVRLVPKSTATLECDYKRFKGVDYLNLIILKEKPSQCYIEYDKNIFDNANFGEKKDKYTFDNYCTKFYLRRGEDTIVLKPNAVDEHMEQLKAGYEEEIDKN